MANAPQRRVARPRHLACTWGACGRTGHTQIDHWARRAHGSTVVGWVSGGGVGGAVGEMRSTAACSATERAVVHLGRTRSRSSRASHPLAISQPCARPPPRARLSTVKLYAHDLKPTRAQLRYFESHLLHSLDHMRTLYYPSYSLAELGSDPRRVRLDPHKASRPINTAIALHACHRLSDPGAAPEANANDHDRA